MDDWRRADSWWKWLALAVGCLAVTFMLLVAWCADPSIGRAPPRKRKDLDGV